MKILTVYFSKTGHTKAIAEMIHKAVAENSVKSVQRGVMLLLTVWQSCRGDWNS